MNKEELWDTLRAPNDHECNNCKWHNEKQHCVFPAYLQYLEDRISFDFCYSGDHGRLLVNWEWDKK